ncbi:MAG TPA: protein phosphatase 2C domain-containing protein [Streptosporangiaceae bacterium]
MRVELATEPGTPGWPNEDFAAAAPGAAVLLDGCTTTPRGASTGCVHGVAWYARALGGALLSLVSADPVIPLAEALASAIEQVRASHAGSCDLANPLTPAATVLAARAAADGVDVLALSDSVIVADYGKDRAPLVITDRHRAASTNPAAAGFAHTGTLPRDGLQAVALLSDGATRIAEEYGLLGWPELAGVLREDGPAGLVAQVRAAEDGDPAGARWPRSKLRDDATVLYWPQPG